MNDNYGAMKGYFFPQDKSNDKSETMINTGNMYFVLSQLDVVTGCKTKGKIKEEKQT